MAVSESYKRGTVSRRLLVRGCKCKAVSEGM